MDEEKRRQLDKLFEVRIELPDFITVEELEILFQKVMKRHDFFSHDSYVGTYWRRALRCVKFLRKQEDPATCIRDIAEYLETTLGKDNMNEWKGHNPVSNGNRIAFKLYVILLYKSKDELRWKRVANGLMEAMGELVDQTMLESIQNWVNEANDEYEEEKAEMLRLNPPVKRRGRPRATLKDKMKDDADGRKLKILHEVMKGKKGKMAALVIIVAVKMGWMTLPTHAEVTEEFDDVGTQQGFTKYLSEKSFKNEEIEGMERILSI